MPLRRLHRAVDDLAMWTEDRKVLPPAAFRPAEAVALDCFGPLPPLPPRGPGPAGPWLAPSPRPAPADPKMSVQATLARGARRGTVILAPPWKLPRLPLLDGWVGALAARGWDVWTVISPRHLHRAAPGTASGDGFVSPDVPALRRALEQLVLELRVLIALARARGGEVGMVGISLGGLAAALAATAPERLDFAALVGPPADVGAVFERTPIGRRFARVAHRAGTAVPPAPALRAMLAPLVPARRAPTAGRVLVAVGSEDRIALPEGALALARAWGAEAALYPRGHLTLIFACRAARRDVARFAVGGAPAREPEPAPAR